MANGSAEVPQNTNVEITYHPDRPEAFRAWVGEFMVGQSLSGDKVLGLSEPKTFSFEIDTYNNLNLEMQTLTGS